MNNALQIATSNIKELLNPSSLAIKVAQVIKAKAANKSLILFAVFAFKKDFLNIHILCACR